MGFNSIFRQNYGLLSKLNCKNIHLKSALHSNSRNQVCNCPFSRSPNSLLPHCRQIAQSRMICSLARLTANSAIHKEYLEGDMLPSRVRRRVRICFLIVRSCFWVWLCLTPQIHTFCTTKYLQELRSEVLEKLRRQRWTLEARPDFFFLLSFFFFLSHLT